MDRFQKRWSAAFRAKAAKVLDFARLAVTPPGSMQFESALARIVQASGRKRIRLFLKAGSMNKFSRLTLPV
jgi:hypothetical protein